MDDIIHLLPDSVANQIAAGEVVQRPSSIVKEMVENSIDAGAQNIQVLVVDGGKTVVQIIDDGKGMSETDARMAFERHATSKIFQASDIYNLTTMGFRGEALASIAAVAHIDLKTRRKEDELGTYVHVAGSEIEAQEPVACPVGSNFSVSNLFYNIPARRKFLKSNQTELTNIVRDFERIVLVHPEITFTMHNNGVEMYRLPATSVRQRIIDIFGKKINTELLPVDVETSLVTITGYVAKPEASKKKGQHTFFFVNGRYMRHPYFHSAVMKAYENIIPAGENVSYFVYLSVDPSTIDVNVHPTKTEIKFDNEQAIWQVLSATVKETIGKFASVPMIDFDVEGKPDIPVMGYNPTTPSQPRPIQATYNPFSSGSGGSSSYKRVDNWETLYNTPEEESDPFATFESSVLNGDDSHVGTALEIPIQDNETSFLPFDESDMLPSNIEGTEPASIFDVTLPKFQFRGQYIVFPSREGLVIVDQCRAHVRVLYEQYISNINNVHRATQKVLFPEVVQFTKGEEVVLEDMMEEISALGFELSNLGGGSYSVRGLPAGAEGLNPDALLHDIVSSAMDKTGAPREEAKEAIALSMAQSSSVVCGQVLSVAEMNQILQDLFACQSSARTPDGKLIYSVLSNKSVEKMF